MSAGAKRPWGKGPISKGKQKVTASCFINPGALLQVESWGGFLFDAPILRQEKKIQNFPVVFIAQGPEGGHMMCCLQAAVFTLLWALPRVQSCAVGSLCQQPQECSGKLPCSVSGVSVWQGIIIISPRKIVSFYLYKGNKWSVTLIIFWFWHRSGDSSDCEEWTCFLILKF